MDNQSFEDFFSNVDDKDKEFILSINDFLLQSGYKTKVELKASGYFVSYSHQKTKKSILNFLFRKKGLIVRIYADNQAKYPHLIESITSNMEKEIIKAPQCKRLINPDDCNPKCIKGYNFFINGTEYKKCRYGCFQFEINSESNPVILEIIKNEVRERTV